MRVSYTNRHSLLISSRDQTDASISTKACAVLSAPANAYAVVSLSANAYAVESASANAYAVESASANSYAVVIIRIAINHKGHEIHDLLGTISSWMTFEAIVEANDK